jgi:uncharacterized phage protein (TIGR02218 family)
MTFDTIERSAESGKPVELYEFVRGGFQRWYFTNSDQNITISSKTYLSTAIGRSALEATPDTARADLTLTAPFDNPVAQLWAIAPPSDTVMLIISQVHAGDTDVAVAWQGRIANVGFEGIQANITCEPTQNAAQRNGLRRGWQKNCAVVLYGQGLGQCNVNKAAFVVAATVQSKPGATTIVSTDFGSPHPSGYFSGGFIEFDNGGLTERRFVTDHSGDTLTLAQQLPALVVGSTLRAYPGCDHTTGGNGCGRFSNQLNYGGQKFFPLKNPFSDNPVYG